MKQDINNWKKGLQITISLAYSDIFG